jgi:hypothetical protein
MVKARPNNRVGQTIPAFLHGNNVQSGGVLPAEFFRGDTERKRSMKAALFGRLAEVGRFCYLYRVKLDRTVAAKHCGLP